MEESWMYIRNSSDFLNKTKNILKNPKGATLGTAGVIWIYPNTPLGANSEAFGNRADGRDLSQVLTEDIIRMADVVLKMDFFGFNGEFKRQKPGATIDTNFATPYACIFTE